MSTGKKTTGGLGSLRPCPPDCDCICHREGGNVSQHPEGYCPGKLLTNTPERIANWKLKKAERNLL